MMLDVYRDDRGRQPVLPRGSIYILLRCGLDQKHVGFAFEHAVLAEEVGGKDPIRVLGSALGSCWRVQEAGPGKTGARA